jgi:hypothetical protein
MSDKDAVFAIYRNRNEIKMAIHALRRLGHNERDMWAFQSKPKGERDFAQVQKYQIKKGALLGAVVGVTLAIALCLLVSVELVHLGPSFRFFREHALLSTVAVILLGTIWGTGTGALIGIGTPDPAAKRYGQYLKSGGILFSVRCGTSAQVAQAQQILEATAGQDVQVANELQTWEEANLERIDLEQLEAKAQTTRAYDDARMHS